MTVHTPILPGLQFAERLEGTCYNVHLTGL